MPSSMHSGSPRPTFLLDSFSGHASSSKDASDRSRSPIPALSKSPTYSSPMSNTGSTPADAPSSSYLRRRSAQQEAASQASSNAAITSSPGVANRRPSAHNAMQSDFSLALTSLSENSPPQLPPLVRSTTPTISANSPLTSLFGKQRAADEIQAVANMVASNDIQRPASAPPRGPRSRHTSKELDDVGAEMMEAAQLDSSPLPQAPSSSSLKDSALETMNLFTSDLSDRSLALLFVFIVMWGAVLSLDRLTTYSYQTIATNSFASHSSLATVNVVRSVVAAVAAIPFAVVADLFGRYQAFTIALLFYTAGHIVMSASMDVPTYLGGVVLYELGANALVCLQNTVLADMTSSRNRLFFQMVPQMPFLVFSFISSDIYSAILPQWRLGIGLFAILGPVSLFPVVYILHTAQKGHKSPAITSTMSLRRANLQQKSSRLPHALLCVQHLWSLADLFGLLLLASSLTLLLVPLTLAASAPHTWESPKILGMISAGGVLGALFLYWEAKKATNPILARILLRNRTFWGGAASLCLLWTAHALMIAYFPTYLYVVHNTSNRAQQNISVIYSFTVAASSLPVALVVRYSRRFKIFALIGVFVFTGGLGMMISLQSTSGGSFHLIASQIVIGLGGALTIALIQSAVQVSVPHTFVAQSIAALNVFPCMGNAVGAAIAGALWGNLLPGRLIQQLASTGHQNELATIYAEPLTWIESYPLGTSARTALIAAYGAVWRVMMVAATIICAASLVSTMCMKNLKLNDFLSAVEGPEKGCSTAGAGSASNEKTDKDHLFGDRLFEKVEHALWKSCARCGIKVGEASASSSNQDGAKADAVKKRPWRPFSRPSPSSCSMNVSGKAASSDAGFTKPSLAPAPILVVDRMDDLDEGLPHTAPVGSSAGPFRPLYSVQRSSPLARRTEGDSYM